MLPEYEMKPPTPKTGIFNQQRLVQHLWFPVSRGLHFETIVKVLLTVVNNYKPLLTIISHY